VCGGSLDGLCGAVVCRQGKEVALRYEGTNREEAREPGEGAQERRGLNGGARVYMDWLRE